MTASGGEWEQVRRPDGSVSWDWVPGDSPVPPPPRVPTPDDLLAAVPPPPHIPSAYDDRVPVSAPPVDYAVVLRWRRRRRAKAAVAVVGAVGILAGGVAAFALRGDDGSREADLAAITRTASDVVIGTDSDRICTTLLSTRFVADVFGDEETCRTAGTDDDTSSQLPTGAAVADLQIHGNKASATVSQVGGPESGAGGMWTFERTDKRATWQVSGWSTAYVRSQFQQLLGARYKSGGEGDGLTDPAIRTCVSEKLQGLVDPAFLDVAHDIYRNGSSGKQRLRTFYYDCASTPGPDGTSALRRLFDDGIRDSNQLPDSLEECMTLRLRELVPDTQLREMFEQSNGDGNVPQEIRSQVVAATMQCAREATGHR